MAEGGALLTPERFARASDATWPGERIEWIGGWKLRFTEDAGSRAASAWAAEAESSMEPTAIAARIGEVTHAYGRAGLRPRFQIWPSDPQIDQALETAGWERYDRSLLMVRPATPPIEVPPPGPNVVREGREAMAVAVRTPIALLDEVWQEGGVGPARRSVLDRGQGPKALFLGRVGMQPAGAVAMTLDGEVGITQALWVVPAARRSGLASVLMAAASRFAADAGASVTAHAVLEKNMPAVRLYERLGFRPFGAYHYRQAPVEGEV